MTTSFYRHIQSCAQSVPCLCPACALRFNGEFCNLSNLTIGLVPENSAATNTSRVKHDALGACDAADVALAAQRARLGLSVEQLRTLIGVSGQSIRKWEQGKAKGRERRQV